MNFFLVRLAVWFVTLVAFPIPVTLVPHSFVIEVLQGINLDAPDARECEEPRCVYVDVNLAERVLARLEQAGEKEIDPWRRDDYRIAWITTAWAQSGVPDWFWRGPMPAHAAATYQVLDCHPDQVWPRIVAKRKEKLGREYSRQYDENDRPIFADIVAGSFVASSPKKPCASERRGVRRKAAQTQNLAA